MIVSKLLLILFWQIYSRLILRWVTQTCHHFDPNLLKICRSKWFYRTFYLLIILTQNVKIMQVGVMFDSRPIMGWGIWECHNIDPKLLKSTLVTGCKFPRKPSPNVCSFIFFIVIFLRTNFWKALPPRIENSCLKMRLLLGNSHENPFWLIHFPYINLYHYDYSSYLIYGFPLVGNKGISTFYIKASTASGYRKVTN